MVDPQSHPDGDAVRDAHPRRARRLQGDEDPELPGHRAADDHRQCLAAGRRPRPARDRGRAQDRELGRQRAGREAHLFDAAGWHRHHQRRVPPREAGAGGARRDARRGEPDTRGPARRPARPGDLEAEHLGHADPHLHRGIVAHGRGGAVLVRRERGLEGPARSAWRRRRRSGRRRGARGTRGTRPGAADRPGRDGGGGVARAAPAAARAVRRPHRPRGWRAGGAHARHRALGRGAGCDRDLAGRRAPGAPRPAGEGQRHDRRTPLGCAAGWSPGGRLRGDEGARRERGRGRPWRA